MGSIQPELSINGRNAAKFDALPASLPLANIDENLDHAAVAAAAIKRLELFEGDLLSDSIVWRDLCALTGTFRTFFGADRVASVWKDVCQVHRPFDFQIVPGSSAILRSGEKSSWVQAEYTFECRGHPALLCSGIVGLIPDPNSSQWKIWLMTTLLEELKGFPSPDKVVTMSNDTEEHAAVENNDYFQCVVVGAGFSGLAMAGRLKAMGVQCLVLEKSPDIGDNWKNRYDSATFHTTKSVCDFPLGKMFTADDPVFPRRNDLIRTYKKYVKAHNLNISCSTLLKHTEFDKKSKIWTLILEKEGKQIILKSHHLVLAIGSLGVIPNMPELYNQDLFSGEVLHSVDYKSSHKWKGKVGIVVGSANTANDVASDMVEAGLASVTMIQRNPTPVFPLEWYKLASDFNYNDKIPMETADRRTISPPVAIVRQRSMGYYQECMRRVPERLNALERAGYLVDRSLDMVKCTFGDGAGGHHTDVGGGAKIVAGKIKVKAGTSVEGFTPSGVRLADGTTLDADVIIFCTGYQSNMRLNAAKLVGDEIGSQLDDFWGIDHEGEVKGAYKRQKQQGIWYLGGGAPWARFGSRFLALQIKADLEGCALPLYKT